MKVMSITFVAAGMFASAGAGYATHQPTQVPAQESPLRHPGNPAAAVTNGGPEAGHGLHGMTVGMESPSTMRLDTTGIVNTQGTQKFDFAIEFGLKSKKRASARYTFEVYTDSGKRVGDVYTSPVLDIEANRDTTKMTLPSTLSPVLGDGFYLAHVVFVTKSTDSGETTVNIDQKFWRVKNGRAVIMTQDEWRTASPHAALEDGPIPEIKVVEFPKQPGPSGQPDSSNRRR
jgi:hypothetical protein